MNEINMADELNRQRARMQDVSTHRDQLLEENTSLRTRLVKLENHIEEDRELNGLLHPDETIRALNTRLAEAGKERERLEMDLEHSKQDLEELDRDYTDKESKAQIALTNVEKGAARFRKVVEAAVAWKEDVSVVDRPYMAGVAKRLFDAVSELE